MAGNRWTLVAVGSVVTFVCLVTGVLGGAILGWPWRTNSIILLALAISTVCGLSVTEWASPLNWAGGYKDLYTEMSGREVDAGRLSWLSRPEGKIYSNLVLVAIVPGLSLAGLIAMAIV